MVKKKVGVKTRVKPGVKPEHKKEIKFYATDDNKLLLMSVDHNFYYLNPNNIDWVQDQRAARFVYSSAPEADPIDIHEALKIVEAWYPGKGHTLIPSVDIEKAYAAIIC